MKSRKYPAALALLGTAACTIAAAYVSSNALAIVFISASLFLVYVTSTCAWALSSVAVPTNCTASVGAMQNFGGYLGGALAPTVTGLIVQATGSFVPALVVGALIGVASAASYLFIVDQPITAHGHGCAVRADDRRVRECRRIERGALTRGFGTATAAATRPRPIWGASATGGGGRLSASAGAVSWSTAGLAKQGKRRRMVVGSSMSR